MKNILIWGTGERTRHFMLIGYFKDCLIKGFVDTYIKEKTYMGYSVYAPEQLKSLEPQVDYIVIANEYYEEIIRQCQNMGVCMRKIVLTDNLPLEPYRQYYLRLKDVSEELFQTLEKGPFILVKANEYDQLDKNMQLTKGKYNRSAYMMDYFRFRTFELAVSELKASNISGEVAELGVFRGAFSALINEHFPDRKLFLFDTFEGFNNEEAEKEIGLGRCDTNFVVGHEDTSVEQMMGNLRHPEMARICKGFFPESITEEAKEATFAFVSLDVDFEESTYQGLKFFYPRMEDGGLIFVHDYNTSFLEGVKEAVNRYERDYKIRLKKVPIADRAGTLIIMR